MLLVYVRLCINPNIDGYYGVMITITDVIGNTYVTAVRYVSAINHETRGRTAPEGE